MIEFRHVEKVFQGKTVFSDLNLELPENCLSALTGQSGCGKTTLLNMLGRLEKPDSGQILFGGTDVADIRQRDYFETRVAFLFQNFALLEGKTVRQNLSLIKGNARSGVSMEEALDRVGMGGAEDTKVYQLSGGEQQRVALARVMMKKADLILADEPTGSLDRENAFLVMECLKNFAREGKTVVMVTHDLALAGRADNVVEITDKAAK